MDSEDRMYAVIWSSTAVSIAAVIVALIIFAGGCTREVNKQDNRVTLTCIQQGGTWTTEGACLRQK